MSPQAVDLPKEEHHQASNTRINNNQLTHEERMVNMEGPTVEKG